MMPRTAVPERFRVLNHVGTPGKHRSLAELEPILLAESKAAAWIARHTASEGQAARWRECGFAPSARVEWVCEGVRITGTVTADGRVALDEPVHGESHLRLTSAWRTVVA